MLVRQFYSKYVAFHPDYRVAQAGRVVLYTFYAHVYDEFKFAPILLITKVTSEAGASRLMNVMELLIRLPYVIVESVERSSFFAKEAVLLGRVRGADGHGH